jgi:hypothetical protein
MLVGALGVVAACGVAFALVSNARDQQAETRDMKDLIGRASVLETSAAPETDLYFQAQTPQLAQADLQTALQSIARSHGAEIDVTQTQDVVRVDGLVHLNLTINGTVPDANLGAFLAALDAARPVILVDELSLRRTRGTRSDAPRQVAFQFSLHGVSL